MILTQILSSLFSMDFLYINLVALLCAYFYARWKRTMGTFWITLALMGLEYVAGTILMVWLSGKWPSW